MAFTVDGTNGFIAKLRKEGAKQSLFEASITLKGTGTGTSDFNYMCKGIQIPASNLGVVTVNYMGRPIKYPGNRTFEDLTTTIINDEGHSIRNQIENWMENINSHTLNSRSSTYTTKDKYVSDLTLKPLTRTGMYESPWKFINCFPTSLDAVEVAWETNDAVMEFNVTWAYDYWTHAGGTSAGGGTPVSIP